MRTINRLYMVFNKDEGLPEHSSNSNVYMTVVRGRLSIGLDEQEVHEYEAGTLLKIPFQTKMNVRNLHVLIRAKSGNFHSHLHDIHPLLQIVGEQHIRA